MPRLARQKSETGFYHILLRGVGRQNIFEDDEDKQRFLETLERYKKELNFELHAYCLMGNHVHLLIKDVANQLDQIMKKIAGSYAYYFNRKYERVGHLEQFFCRDFLYIKRKGFQHLLKAFFMWCFLI